MYPLTKPIMSMIMAILTPMIATISILNECVSESFVGAGGGETPGMFAEEGGGEDDAGAEGGDGEGDAGAEGGVEDGGTGGGDGTGGGVVEDGGTGGGDGTGGGAVEDGGTGGGDGTGGGVVEDGGTGGGDGTGSGVGGKSFLCHALGGPSVLRLPSFLSYLSSHAVAPLNIPAEDNSELVSQFVISASKEEASLNISSILSTDVPS